MKTFKKVMIWTGAGLLALVFFAMSLVGAILVMKTIFTSACQAVVDSIDIPTFEEKCGVTDDGFVFYLDYNRGLCLIEVPNQNVVAIPEYIGDVKVMQLGYEEVGLGYTNTYTLFGHSVRELTITHPLNVYAASFKLEQLNLVDFLYIESNYDRDVLTVPNVIGNRIKDYNDGAEVHLLKTDRLYSLAEFKASEIVIPDYVTLIEDGVFDGLEGTVIKTEYESQPAGWEDGWNGDCEVIWGAEL